MEQNLVSDEELLKRLNTVLHDSKQASKKQIVNSQQEDICNEKFHDVYETTEEQNANGNQSEVKILGSKKNLVHENHYLSAQLQAEKNRSKELQSKFKLFENSVKYFERLNGQLETIKKTVDEEYFDTKKGESGKYNLQKTMQKIRPKTIHTAANALMDIATTDETCNETVNFSEPQIDKTGNKQKISEDKEEVAFRDAEDFKQLEQGLEIIKEKQVNSDSEIEKVFITKTEKRCLEDIGNIAARTRAPLDDKHQRYFEKDRRKFANSIVMPEIQEVDKAEVVPPEIITKTKETPLNITSTELDGLRSYLLQLKELIARRETAWARTTERDYNQRVEITRYKNEVSHLRMLCEKRQRDIKERDQIIATKDEEIRELQKRIQGLKNVIMKLEKKDENLMNTIDGMTNEVLENSNIVQRSYNAMKRQSIINSINISTMKPANMTLSRSRDALVRKPKLISEKASLKKVRGSELTSNDEGNKSLVEKVIQNEVVKDENKIRHKSESLHKAKETFNKVDEKLQQVEEMLHNEVLKKTKKALSHGRKSKNQTNMRPLTKNQTLERNSMEFSHSNIKKLTPSNSTIRQEMLTAMTGLNTKTNLGLRTNFTEPKKNHANAAIIANALLAARNVNLFNY